jgi:hypothetical protein
MESPQDQPAQKNLVSLVGYVTDKHVGDLLVFQSFLKYATPSVTIASTATQDVVIMTIGAVVSTLLIAGLRSLEKKIELYTIGAKVDFDNKDTQKDNG